MKKSFVLLLITGVIALVLTGCEGMDSLTKEWNDLLDGIENSREQYDQEQNGEEQENQDKEETPEGTNQEQENEEENLQGNSDTNDTIGNQEEMQEGADVQTLPDITALDPSTTKEEMAVRESIGLTDAHMPALFQEQSGNYAYDLMTGNRQKQLYIEIYSILCNQAEDVVLCSTDIDTIDYVFQCVMNDHPEIFYVTGYTYTKFSINEVVKRVAFTGTYTMSQPTIGEMENQIEQYATQCIAGVPQGADDYETVKYIYEYLVNHTEYDLQAKENQNITSVCAYGASVCQGYAKTLQYLLNRMDIPTTLVIGTVNTGEGHAWNLVQLEDGYYYVDVTWGDAFYQLEGNAVQNLDSRKIPKINYDYLCVTTEQLCTTHVIDNIVPMPECVATDNNYYVREGYYFNQYDIQRVEQLFQQAYTSNQGFVTLKCADREVYRQMKKNLIEDQVVFQFLDTAAKTIAYAGNEEQMTFTFWL